MATKIVSLATFLEEKVAKTRLTKNLCLEHWNDQNYHNEVNAKWTADKVSQKKAKFYNIIRSNIISAGKN